MNGRFPLIFLTCLFTLSSALAKTNGLTEFQDTYLNLLVVDYSHTKTKEKLAEKLVPKKDYNEALKYLRQLKGMPKFTRTQAGFSIESNSHKLDFDLKRLAENIVFINEQRFVRDRSQPLVPQVERFTKDFIKNAPSARFHLFVPKAEAAIQIPAIVVAGLVYVGIQMSQKLLDPTADAIGQATCYVLDQSPTPEIPTICVQYKSKKLELAEQRRKTTLATDGTTLMRIENIKCDFERKDKKFSANVFLVDQDRWFAAIGESKEGKIEAVKLHEIASESDTATYKLDAKTHLVISMNIPNPNFKSVQDTATTGTDVKPIIAKFIDIDPVTIKGIADANVAGAAKVNQDIAGRIAKALINCDSKKQNLEASRATKLSNVLPNDGQR